MTSRFRVVAFHDGPAWYVRVKRMLRPYRWVTRTERPSFELRAQGYLNAVIVTTETK